MSLKRIFTREQIYGEFTHVKERTKIGVIGLGRSAGTTFFALALAQELESRKKSVAFVELSQVEEGKSMVYHVLGMDQRFAHGRYRQIFSQVENNRRVNGKENIDAGINWAVLHPEEMMRGLTLSSLQETKLINNFSGDYIVCDMGCRYREEVMSEMDIIFTVVDPLPSKLIASRNVYENLVRDGRKIVWVLNKDNSGVHRRHLYKYVKVKGHETIPLLQGEFFYKAEYNCRLPYEQKEIRVGIKPIMENIVNFHILATNG